ncbi:cytochrome c [Pelomonas sp. APW6]|uniref:Cytochrome c n=1 Tax=Roseateles subflavus TaxID=3053353 RepID=A0ABT7LIC8_9BURK|nr:cytochrome c [Pelomonas sp. APW6]MDL5032616.1 cytochrome c [Pelomonas sp. APW6]
MTGRAAKRLRSLAPGLVLRLVLGVALAGSGLAGWVLWVNRPGPLPPAPPARPTAELQARGAYLARVGNCAGCHTAPGGAPLAGGRAIPTPFGAVYSGNLTPDAATGLGRWTADDFWRALHEGRSRDGRLLSPAFPYTSYTLLSRADSDALFSHLQSQPAVHQPPRPQTLPWPYGSAWALAAWRALFFRPASFEPDPRQDAAWNRGAYLTQGVAHCNACHSSRNALGGPQARDRFDGSLLRGLGWEAPSLHRPAEAGMQDWTMAEAAAWLRQGVSERGVAQGPMAEVIVGSTRHLSEADAEAMARYLRALPTEGAPHETPAKASPLSPARPPDTAPGQALLGARLYETHCQACHGAGGEGRPGVYPPLKGSRVVLQPSAINLVRIVQQGGFAPATPQHPRPFGMPPFAGTFNAEQLAALLSHVRTSWGQPGGALSARQVQSLTNDTGINP